MEDKEEGLEASLLAVGCTRPATTAGIPMNAFLVELVVVMEIFIFSRNLFALLAIIPTHIVLYLICLAEPRIFDLLILWARTKGRALLWFASNWQFWGVNSYSPLSIDVGRSKRKFKEKFK